MLMNYHEMTMNEPRDSPARRKQYLVICTVMLVVFLHALFTSGVLISPDISVENFEGGDFTFKSTTRDYAASMALLQSIAEDAHVKKDDYEDTMYCLYLDNPMQAGGGRQRFASGIVTKQASSRDLMENNNDSQPPLSLEQQQDKSVESLIPLLKYQTAKLPPTKAAVLNFPFTNGFVSALVLSYKIIPAMRKYAAKQGVTGTVVLSTCSIKQEMCTHYAPLEHIEPYLLGQPDTDTYLNSMPKEKVLDWRHVYRGSKKKFGKFFGLGDGNKVEKKKQKAEGKAKVQIVDNEKKEEL